MCEMFFIFRIFAHPESADAVPQTVNQPKADLVLPSKNSSESTTSPNDDSKVDSNADSNTDSAQGNVESSETWEEREQRFVIFLVLILAGD